MSDSPVSFGDVTEVVKDTVTLGAAGVPGAIGTGIGAKKVFDAKTEDQLNRLRQGMTALPKAPTPENSQAAQDAAAAEQRRGRSRSATILTGANSPQGTGPGVGSISRKTLLGA